MLISIYLAMPAGRLTLSHALVWDFATLSQIGTVCDPPTAAIAVPLSLEQAVALSLLGAPVISEHERLAQGAVKAP